MNCIKVYTVESSHGELIVDSLGKVITRTPPCCDACIMDIASFDLDEFKTFYNVDKLPEFFDILDLGGEMASGRKFTASENYRKSVAL